MTGFFDRLISPHSVRGYLSVLINLTPVIPRSTPRALASRLAMTGFFDSLSCYSMTWGALFFFALSFW